MIPRRTKGLALGVGLFAACGCGTGTSLDAAPSPFDVVRDGKPLAVIVVPDELGRHLGALNAESPEQARELPDGPVLRGVLDLADVIRKSTRVRLPVVVESDANGSSTNKIYVGSCRRTREVLDRELASEESWIRVDEDEMFLVGGDRGPPGTRVAGTRHAVSRFLEEHVGVRWLFPGDLGEVVPPRSELRVAVHERREQPSVAVRKIRNSRSSGERKRIAALLDEWGVSRDLWFDRHWDLEAREWFRRMGVGSRETDIFGHSFEGWWKEYGAKHEEYFALQPDGTRNQSPPRERLCLSTPGLWDLVAATRLEALAEKPSGVSIGLNDGGRSKFCMCSACRSWDPENAPAISHPLLVDPETARPFSEYPSLSDRVFRFYNEVARRVGRRAPGARLGCYAYSTYRTPPVELTRLEPNLVVSYAGLDLDEIREWGELASELWVRPNVLWDNHGFGLPRNPALFLAGRVRAAREHGVRAFDFDGCVGHWGTQGLSYYVLAKTLLDSDGSVASWIDEYCELGFGRSNGAVRTYFEQLHDLDQEIRESDYRGRSDNPSVLLIHYTEKRFQSWEKLLTQAVLEASEDRERARVALLQEGLETGRLVVRALGEARAARKKREWARVRAAQGELERALFKRLESRAVAVPHAFLAVRPALGRVGAPDDR